MMNMYVMLMLMLWDVNACLTPRGVTRVIAFYQLAPNHIESIGCDPGNHDTWLPNPILDGLYESCLRLNIIYATVLNQLKRVMPTETAAHRS
jgi:hypothetical protein